MKLTEPLVPRWRHKLFVGYVGAMILVFLLPVPTELTESEHVDKVVHFGIFLGFALLSYADRHWKAGWLFVVSVLFAGIVELVQSTLPYRDGDWVDFAAGTAGAALGTILVLVVRRVRGR
jgi:VanZ family protein